MTGQEWSHYDAPVEKVCRVDSRGEWGGDVHRAIISSLDTGAAGLHRRRTRPASDLRFHPAFD